MNKNNRFVVLCKFANEIEEQDADETIQCFRYRKKFWRMKDDFSDAANEFAIAAKICELNKSKKITLLPLKPNAESGKTCEELALVYVDVPSKKDEMAVVLTTALFPLIFDDYEPDLEQEMGCIDVNYLDKSYVTNKLYNGMSEQHEYSTDLSGIEINLPAVFQPTLRGYQKNTVKWLLQREQVVASCPTEYVKLHSRDGESIVYKHEYCMHFYCAVQETELPPSIKTYTLPPGGILADEMGLGKTVELIALILLNPRTDISNTHIMNQLKKFVDDLPRKRHRYNADVFCICTSKSQKRTLQCSKCKLWQHIKCVNSYARATDADSVYICPMCWTELTEDREVQSGATFIVTPSTIKTQWQSEISNHTQSSLRVLRYEGMNSGRWINPVQLAEYDIVITDYNILRTEFYHTPEFKSERVTRHPKKFMQPTSPLLMVHWWRVCLDEAQMVDSNTSKAAGMTRKLPATNRWAVTGTPIQNTIDDLVPLLIFCGFKQIYDPPNSWFTKMNAYLLIYREEIFTEMLQQCLWRTCKSNILDELGIPAQLEQVHNLYLSNVEMLHYREQHSSCTTMFLSNVEKHVEGEGETRLAKISPALLKNLLSPLLKIRQCCTMPVVQGSIGRMHSGHFAHKQFMNPKELLQHLMNANELECKAQLRSWASAYNGIAAVHFINKKYLEAIKQYELVLRLAKNYNGQSMTVDTLLQIHALHNLIEANEMTETCTVPVEAISAYNKQLNMLDWKYLAPCMEVLAAARMSYQSSVAEYARLQAQSPDDILTFFISMVSRTNDVENALLLKLRDEAWAHGFGNEMFEDANTLWGIVVIIELWYQNLEYGYLDLLEAFQKLKYFTEDATQQHKLGHIRSKVQAFVESVSDCHLLEIRDEEKGRTRRKKKPKCKLCKMRKIINQFECLFYTKRVNEDAIATGGMENISFELLIIKITFNFLKTKPEFAKYQQDFNRFWKSMEVLRTLAKKQIKYWIEIEYAVKAFDELDMCKMRISLTKHLEEKSSFRVMRYELNDIENHQKYKLHSAQMNFSRLVGRLKYLKHLEEDTPEISCPICQSDDDERYSVLECGHIICCTCLKRIRQYKKQQKMECPVCRSESNLIYYALKKNPLSTIKGVYSSKVTYIVELVKKLCNNEPNEQVKILIFSQWDPILKAISAAFTENDVRHRAQCTPRAIDDFKDPNLNITCMLMPFASGSKGLNLIEATHVFLVEPILNPGEEQQAIGRVHRFGQTKTTTVHRFIVCETIEENIHNFIISKDRTSSSRRTIHWELECMSWENLTDLFTLNDDDPN